jgi:hypothetical protein
MTTQFGDSKNGKSFMMNKLSEVNSTLEEIKFFRNYLDFYH